MNWSVATLWKILRKGRKICSFHIFKKYYWLLRPVQLVETIFRRENTVHNFFFLCAVKHAERKELMVLMVMHLKGMWDSCFQKCHLKWKENDTQLQWHAKGEIPFIKLSTEWSISEMFDREEYVLSNVVWFLRENENPFFQRKLMGKCSHNQRSGHAILFVLLFLLHFFL